MVLPASCRSTRLQAPQDRGTLPDKKMKGTARSLFSAAGALFCPLLATTLLSQAVTVWSKDLSKGLEESPDYITLLDQMIIALQLI